MKVAFLDRDGTIIKDYPDKKWKEIKEPEFLYGAIEGMKMLNKAGFELIIVTNQYLINDGIITLDDYYNFNQKVMDRFLKEDVKVLDVFFCPHSKKEKCNCCKPAVGMVEVAINKYCKIDLSKSIMIGDSRCDKEFANTLGLDFYGIVGGNLANQKYAFESIKDIAIYINT